MPSTLAADASPAFRAVADALVAAMQATGVPGAAVGVLWGDQEEHATFGVESLSSLRPVTEQTHFQIGSLTKTYTATVIWHLIDQGALSLGLLGAFPALAQSACRRICSGLPRTRPRTTNNGR